MIRPVLLLAAILASLLGPCTGSGDGKWISQSMLDQVCLSSPIEQDRFWTCLASSVAYYEAYFRDPCDSWYANWALQYCWQMKFGTAVDDPYWGEFYGCHRMKSLCCECDVEEFDEMYEMFFWIMGYNELDKCAYFDDETFEGFFYCYYFTCDQLGGSRDHRTLSSGSGSANNEIQYTSQLEDINTKIVDGAPARLQANAQGAQKFRTSAINK
ncbi:hypothetical protein HDE_09217 [Halotydeus destructor]|nr:hypothetical protein HDE_09217 [Halotydeus destructor]